MKEAIEFIHHYRGVACLAHPWLCSDGLDACREAFQWGIDGIECFPPKHHIQFKSTRYLHFAKEHSLFCSSGSDFHSTRYSLVDVGKNIFPEEDAAYFIEMMKKNDIL